MSRNVSVKKMKAVLALCQCSTISAAAVEAKVNRKTLGRWMREDLEFQKALQESRRLLLQHGSTRICGMLSRALDVLRDTLAGDAVGKDQYLSARFVIETGLGLQQDDVETRVCELENRVRNGQWEREERFRQMSDQEIKSEIRRLAPEIFQEFDDDELRELLRSRISRGGDT